MEIILPSRQHQILINLVLEFIESAEPVSSGTLVKKYRIQASSATIRSDMAKLEDEGYLMQPHTSSGRIPTDKAYRYYVNYLTHQEIFIPREINDALQDLENFDAHIQRTLEYSSHLLSDLTRLTSLVLAPRIRSQMFRYLRISPLEENRLLLIVMTNTGAVINKVIQMSRGILPGQMERITNILNERLAGKYLSDFSLNLFSQFGAEMNREILEEIGKITRDALTLEDGKFIYDGAKHLLELPEFQNLEKLKIVINLLEDEKLVAEILKKTLSAEGMKIYIGQEHQQQKIRECTLITATYGICNTPMGVVGVLGPTRMDYYRVIPVVQAFAHIFSKKLSRF